METKVSVTIILVFLTASTGSCVNNKEAPVSLPISLHLEAISESNSIPAGVATATLIPNLTHATAKSLITLLESPTQVNFKPLISPKVSLIVNRSAIACNGWYISHRELMIGTEECSHNCLISLCELTLAKIQEVMDETTLIVS
ncbi:unnamed protein product [[Candida] boidinii]|nr:unnamed protein product [[Candida] boidinii]